MVSVALSAPGALGMYATLSAHEPPALSVTPHVLPLTRNSLGLLLLSAMPLAAAPPEFVMVSAAAALVWPTVTLPKESTGGDPCRLATPAATPVPDSAIARLMPVPVIA